jgi:hypothetical protein
MVANVRSKIKCGWTKSILLIWIDDVLKPHIETKPDGVDPLLFPYSFRFQVMASVVNKIQDLGVQLVHIPAGLTSIGQPIDAGIRKPLKIV